MLYWAIAMLSWVGLFLCGYFSEYHPLRMGFFMLSTVPAVVAMVFALKMRE